MNKSLLTLVIIALLPFGARGDFTYNYVDTPARVANNGTVTIVFDGPYQTITPGEHDDEHIASTSYVIGAYNDAIAAINTKQGILRSEVTGEMLDGNVYGSGDFLDTLSGIGFLSGEQGEKKIISAAAVVAGIKSQQVKIYTTWEDDSDSATTHVLLDTVLPDDD